MTQLCLSIAVVDVMNIDLHCYCPVEGVSSVFLSIICRTAVKVVEVVVRSAIVVVSCLSYSGHVS